MTPKFALKDLHKSFGHKHVLQDIDLEVHPGELGPQGRNLAGW
jgi:ABC-type uncharacterized transport system ATPase subunit